MQIVPSDSREKKKGMTMMKKIKKRDYCFWIGF